MPRVSVWPPSRCLFGPQSCGPAHSEARCPTTMRECPRLQNVRQSVSPSFRLQGRQHDEVSSLALSDSECSRKRGARRCIAYDGDLDGVNEASAERGPRKYSSTILLVATNIVSIVCLYWVLRDAE